MNLPKSQKGFVPLIIIVIVAVILLTILAGIIYKTQILKNNNLPSPLGQLQINSNSPKDNSFSRQFSRGKCRGMGTVSFTHLPMDLPDIGAVLPYGTMVDAHVIPTSHGYFAPADFHSPRDQYPVYAIADGFIVNISHRSQSVGDGPKTAHDEYQMQFEHSCTFYTYYDLLTSLAPDLQQVVGQLQGFESKTVRIPVKAGQLLGRVGGQTVDFAVWNFENSPNYFVNPKSYEEDRPYLDDMFKYFAEPQRSQLLTKAARVVEPRSGKVNYDIPGKLVGGWFREGSGGFSGPPGIQMTADRRYWDGHLAIVYDYIDPTSIKFSIGNYNGKASQFGVKGNFPDPATVGVDSGTVKYELVTGGYVNGDTGQPWMLSPPISKPQFKTDGQVQGTVLLQMIAPDRLKLELFPNKTASQVTDFDSSVQIYTR